MQQVWTALRGEPLDLLGLASSMLTLIDPREQGPFRAPRDLDRAGLIDSLIEIERIETTALLTALRALCGEELMATRMRRELAQRSHPLPAWLAGLDDATPAKRAVVMTDPLGDGDNVMIGVDLPGGAQITAVVYIEHNLGSLVKDAFVLPGALDEVLEYMERLSEDPDVIFAALDPADARARITEAIGIAAMMVPPFETDTWPAARPLLEWMTAMLPAGGRGYERPEWSERKVQALADRFFAAALGAGFDDALHREMLGHVLWFATGYGPGDPLRWSSIAVEILLLDWLPRKIADTAQRLAVIPALLGAFVRFCHAERGLRPGLTDQVLATIVEYEPDYLDAIAAPRLQGPAALLARMGALDPDAEADMLFDPDNLDLVYFEDDGVVIADLMLDQLRRAVGSEAALENLDDLPLADEPFAWAVVPTEVHDRVREVLALTEACCTDLLDDQYRTVIRRLLADIAAADPAIFRRNGRAETAAAAICWIAGSANSLFDHSPVRPKVTYVKDLYAYFGLKPTFSASQRAQPMLRAIGVDPYGRFGSQELGSPRYLTASCRAHLISLRDRYRALRAEGLSDAPAGG